MISNNFFDNLFGVIAAGNGVSRFAAGYDFLPVDDKGKTIDITNRATWLGLKAPLQQKYAYEFCYPVSSVVDRLAEYDLAGEVEIVKVKGKGKEDLAKNDWANKMNALIAQPNPLQSWEQFRGQQLVYKRVFGFCPVLPLIPIGFDPSDAVAMINLPPWLFQPVHQQFDLLAVDMQQTTQQYVVNILGKQITLKASDIFILEDSFHQQDNLILPLSKLVGLDMAVSNICAAMEADNVLLKKKGPLGFVAHDAAATKDSVAGYLPMSVKEKNRLQTALNRYGLGWNQMQYVVSRTAAKWVPMSYNVKELGTKESVEQGAEAICQRFGFPYILFKESGATYANGENAMSSVYVNNVIPNNKKDLNKYNKFFEATANDCKITGCYDDIPALQEDELNKNTAAKSLAETLDIEWKSGIITKNQWLTARGYETVVGGDTYYQQPAQQVATNQQQQ